MRSVFREGLALCLLAEQQRATPPSSHFTNFVQVCFRSWQTSEDMTQAFLLVTGFVKGF